MDKDILFGIIFADANGDYDFEVCRGLDLANVLRYKIGNAFVQPLHITTDCDEFYTTFDDDIKDSIFHGAPFLGMLSAFTDEDEVNGGTILVWVKDQRGWSAYDYDEYVEEKEDTESLTEMKRCRL